MTRLWDLWTDYCDRIPYPPSERRFARDIGMSPTAFGNWENGISRLPDKMNLATFARLIHMPYERVLDAALHDSGYLPDPMKEGGEEHDRSAATKTPEVPLLAVASGDQNDAGQAAEADRLAEKARSEQEAAIQEMDRKKRNKK